MSALGILGIPNPLDIGSALAGNIVADLLSSLGTAIEAAIASGVRDSVSAVVSLVNNSAGVVSFGPSSWWGKAVGSSPSCTGLWATIVALGLETLLVAVVLAVIQGVRAGEPMAVLRALAVEAPISIFGMVAVIGLTTALLSAVDHASSAVLPNVAKDLGTWAGGDGVGAFTFFGSLVAALGLVATLAVWVELVVRSGLIFLLVALSPLMLALRVWPAAAGVWRRGAEVGVALILTKFVIALALALGAAALAGSVTGPTSVTAETTGAGLMLVAAVSPFVLFRVLPGLEGAMGAAGISRMPLRVAQTGLSVAYTGAMLSRLAGGSAVGTLTAPGATGGGTGGPGPGRSTSLARAATFEAASRPAGELGSARPALGPAPSEGES